MVSEFVKYIYRSCAHWQCRGRTWAGKIKSKSRYSKQKRKYELILLLLFSPDVSRFEQCFH